MEGEESGRGNLGRVVAARRLGEGELDWGLGMALSLKLRVTELGSILT